VGGDFLNFFTLPDGSIGLSGRRHGETCGGIIRSAGCGDLARGSQDRRATAFSIAPAYPQGDAARTDSTLRSRTVCMFRPAHRNLTNSERGDGGAVLLSAQGNRELDLRAIPPGMFPEIKCDSETVQLQLERGDSLTSSRPQTGEDSYGVRVGFTRISSLGSSHNRFTSAEENERGFTFALPAHRSCGRKKFSDDRFRKARLIIPGQNAEALRPKSGNFSERWILRSAEFRGRILWHGKRLEECENSRENWPEEILQQLREAVVSYSCSRSHQDDRTAAILRCIGR